MLVTVHISIVEGDAVDLATDRPKPIEERRFAVEDASAEEVEQALKDAGITLRRLP